MNRRQRHCFPPACLCVRAHDESTCPLSELWECLLSSVGSTPSRAPLEAALVVRTWVEALAKADKSLTSSSSNAVQKCASGTDLRLLAVRTATVRMGCSISMQPRRCRDAKGAEVYSNGAVCVCVTGCCLCCIVRRAVSIRRV